MITRERKKQIVAQLVEMLSDATAIYITDFAGITVEEAIQLRRSMKDKGIKFRIAKNTLIIRALNQIGNESIPAEKFFGQSALVLGYDDPIAPAKIIKEYFDKKEKLRLKVASIEGQLFDGSQLDQISKLQTKNELIAGIMFLLDSPVTGIVGSINAVIRDLAYLIEEVANKKAS